MKTCKTLEVTFATAEEARQLLWAFPFGPGAPKCFVDGNRVLFLVQRRTERQHLRFVATMCGGTCRTLVG